MTIPAGPQLTVYLLCQYPQRPMSFAPHGWKTLLPLRYLNVRHDIIYVTLAELREELPAKFHLPKVTLPALVIDGDTEQEEILMDSCNIAYYVRSVVETFMADETLQLETHYGTREKSIYNGDIGRRYSRFIEQWVDRSLAADIRPCVLHTSYAQFPEQGPLADTASRSAFLAKCGQAKMDELTSLNGNPKWSAERYAATRKELGTIETVLKEKSNRGEGELFLGGLKPIHADFCVYAFYAYSRTNKELVEQTWHHESLPHVRVWLQAIQDLGLVSEKELFNL
ncbi:hypothetical protein P7C73_g1981, partial [Tremellales sp. Uapishka_1]